MPKPDYRPRNRLPVLMRTLCLSAFVLRGLMEHIIATHTDPIERGRATTRTVELNIWLRQEGLSGHRSPQEKALLEKEPGTWAVAERAAASWRSEALGVLVWAIDKRHDIPAAGVLFEAGEVLDTLPNIGPIEMYLRYSKLRAADDVLWARDVAELWHWRARMEVLRRAGRLDADEAHAEITHVAAGAHQHGAIAALVEGDFPVEGQPVTALSDDTLDRLRQSLYQRHLALNWLCLPATEWDTTPTDT